MGTTISAVSEIRFILPLNHMNVKTGWGSKDLKNNPSLVKFPGSFHLCAKIGRKLGQRQTSLCQSLLCELKTLVYVRKNIHEGKEFFRIFGFIHDKI